MTDQELEQILSDLESDRAERKASTVDGEKIRQAICAFANDLPNHRTAGVVFVGVHDDGSPSSLTVTDQILTSLANMRSDGNILPLPTMVVQKKELRGANVVVVIVEPADAPPVRLRGRVYVRVGPTCRVASAEEERRLAEKRRAKDQPFDLSPVPTATVADFDLDLFQRTYLRSAVAAEVLEQNQRSLDEQLTALRFLTVGDPARPTTVGILVVGSDPARFLPGAYIQFLRVEGCGLGDPIKDAKELTGPIPELLKALEETLRINISSTSDVVSGPAEVRVPDYPFAALWQLAVNAVLHRTYEGTNAPVRITWFDNRVEIQSPGGPFGQVTTRNFGQPGLADYRNPHLAEAMKNLGYVQRFGVGIQIARKELAANDNPELEFVVEASHVLAVIRRRA